MTELPEGYTSHDGGECPVEPGAWLHVIFRGEADPTKGVLREFEFGHAGTLAWHHDGEADDIIAYRIIPTPETPNDQ